METYQKSLSYYAQKYHKTSPANLTILQRFIIDNTLNYKPPELTAKEFDEANDVDATQTANLILSRHKRKYIKNVLFVTVNPPDGSVTPSQLVRMAQACANYSNVLEYSYCIETRGHQPSTQYHGMHLHMILVIKPVNHAISKVRTNVRNKFMNLKNINDLSINIKTVDLTQHNPLYRYLMGIKNGAPKKHSDYDHEFRKLHGIDNLYEG